MRQAPTSLLSVRGTGVRVSLRDRPFYQRSPGGRRPHERYIRARRRQRAEALRERRRRVERFAIAAHPRDVIARRGACVAGASQRRTARLMLDERPVPRHVHARIAQRRGNRANQGAVDGLAIGAIRDASVDETQALAAVGCKDGEPTVGARPGRAQAIRDRDASRAPKLEAHRAGEASRTRVWRLASVAVGGSGSVEDGAAGFRRGGRIRRGRRAFAATESAGQR